MLKRSELCSQIRELEQHVHAWEAADAPYVEWRGRRRKAISNALIEAWHELFQLVGTNDVSEDVKAIILHIDLLEDELEKWAEMCDLAPEDADPRGSSELWTKWGELLELLVVPQRRKPEDIRTLIEQKVTDRQIALIYGWKDEADQPDLERVRREKANPGSEYDPDTWVHPSEVRERDRISAEWRNRQHRVDDRVAQQYTRPECPETIEELITQRVSSKQIAQMKRVSIEEVQAIAAKMRVPLDGQYVRPVSPHDRLAAIREEEESREANLSDAMNPQDSGGDQSTSLVDRVLDMYLDGKQPGEIANALKGDYPNLTHQKVSGIIKRAEEENSQQAAT